MNTRGGAYNAYAKIKAFMRLSTRQRGFTIVELLIVIVVIAILAAITVVAFNGVKSRSTNALVQSDLSANMKRVKLYMATNGTFPDWGEVGTDPSLKMKVSKRSAYSYFHYCGYATWWGQPLSGVGIIVGSTTNVTYASTTGSYNVTDVSSTITSSTAASDACTAIAPSGLIPTMTGMLIRTDGSVDGSIDVAAP